MSKYNKLSSNELVARRSTTQPLRPIDRHDRPLESAVLLAHHTYHDGARSYGSRLRRQCRCAFIFSACMVHHQTRKRNIFDIYSFYIGLSDPARLLQDERARRLQWHLHKGACHDHHTRDTRWKLHFLVSIRRLWPWRTQSVRLHKPRPSQSRCCRCLRCGHADFRFCPHLYNHSFADVTDYCCAAVGGMYNATFQAVNVSEAQAAALDHPICATSNYADSE